MVYIEQPALPKEWLEDTAEDAEVIPLGFGSLTDNRLDVEAEADDDKRDWNRAKNWLILLLVAAVVGLLAWLGFSVQSNQAQPVQEVAVDTQLESELEAVQKQLRQAPSPTEVDQLREDNAELESQLQTTLDEINTQVGVVEQLTEEKVEAQLRAETEFNRAELATDEVLRQVEVVEQREAQLREAEALQTETEAQLDKATAQARSYEVSLRQAEVVLEGEYALEPVRAMAVADVAGEIMNLSSSYNLGRVTYLYDPEGGWWIFDSWNNEEQEFIGVGYIGYTNRFEEIEVAWRDGNLGETLEITLPLPVVEAAKSVILDGKTDLSNRDRLNRAGGAYGDLTPNFVDGKARGITRSKACEDVARLRQVMAVYTKYAGAIASGVDMSVVWLGRDGKVISNPSNSQVVDEAC